MKSKCCNAPLLDGVQCEVCGADGRQPKTNLVRSETDIDRLIDMFRKDFPLEFTVAQGGNSVRIKINASKFIVLQRDGKWSYE